MDDMLAESADKLFAGIAAPAAVREIERTADAAALWRSVEEAGFCDALVPEDAGGAGLSLHDVFGLLLAAGRHALPVPLATTCWVRRLLAQRSIDAPTGPIALAAAPLVEADGGWTARMVPFGRVADWVVAQRGDMAWLLPAESAVRQDIGVHGSLSAHLRWSAWPGDRAIELGNALPWLETGAVLCAASIAGALDKVLDLTVQYANERVQFGRSIGKFQAVQQNISEIAELARASMLAAEMGAQAGLPMSSAALHAALAKARTSAAVPRVVAVAHAVHGAMGVTAEYPLHLWTRRLHEWRLDFGAETFWHRRIGGALLDRPDGGSALDFVLDSLAPVEPA